MLDVVLVDADNPVRIRAIILTTNWRRFMIFLRMAHSGADAFTLYVPSVFLRIYFFHSVFLNHLLDVHFISLLFPLNHFYFLVFHLIVPMSYVNFRWRTIVLGCMLYMTDWGINNMCIIPVEFLRTSTNLVAKSHDYVWWGMQSSGYPEFIFQIC